MGLSLYDEMWGGCDANECGADRERGECDETEPVDDHGGEAPLVYYIIHFVVLSQSICHKAQFDQYLVYLTAVGRDARTRVECITEGGGRRQGCLHIHSWLEVLQLWTVAEMVVRVVAVVAGTVKNIFRLVELHLD